jgi:hypothetical protein
VYLDALAFVSGPAQIQLTALSIKRSPASATERRLISLLYSRAQAHSP